MTINIQVEKVQNLSDSLNTDNYDVFLTKINKVFTEGIVEDLIFLSDIHEGCKVKACFACDAEMRLRELGYAWNNETKTWVPEYDLLKN